MIDPIRELKVRAEILHHRARALEGASSPDETTGDVAELLAPLRTLAELRKASDAELRAAAPGLQRKHFLTAVARAAGFSGWEHAHRVLGGEPSETDFGKSLYPDGRGSHLNHWFASYDEAHASLVDAEARGDRRYLLAYQRHFFLTDRHFIDSLGLDPSDPDWAAIGWNWAKPHDVVARTRLYAKLLAARAPRPAAERASVA